MYWVVDCKQSGGNPYVVASSETVKDCAVNGTVSINDCRKCAHYLNDRQEG